MRPLNIAVCVKRVQHFELARYSRLALSADRRRLECPDSSFVISSSDQVALEEALSLREARGGEVTAISAGPPESKEQLQKCLILGADRAILVEDLEWATRDCLATATMLTACLRDLDIDLVLTGNSSEDQSSSAVGAMIATYLGWSCVTDVTRLDIEDRNGTATRGRPAETCTETLAFRLPAVLTCELSLNKPRFASLRNIMERKRIQPEIRSVAQPSAAASLVSLELQERSYPRQRRMLGTDQAIEGLVDALRFDARVLSRA